MCGTCVCMDVCMDVCVRVNPCLSGCWFGVVVVVVLFVANSLVVFCHAKMLEKVRAVGGLPGVDASNFIQMNR